MGRKFYQKSSVKAYICLGVRFDEVQIRQKSESPLTLLIPQYLNVYINAWP